jgi:signal peptidase I
MSALFEPTLLDLLASGYGVRFRARGTSMEPCIRSGDYLQVRANGIEPPRVGEIVLANLERGLTAHRVIAVVCDAAGEISIMTRGDNATMSDAPFPMSGLIGVVSDAERNGRRVCLKVRRIIRSPFARGWVRRANDVQRGISCLWSGISRERS